MDCKHINWQCRIQTITKKGKAVISSDDEWKDETEWDDMFEQMKKERGIE